MVNHPNRTTKANFRVTGDFMRLVYSSHRSEEAAWKAARALARKWGVSHIGSEPRVEQRTEVGWIDIGAA